MSIITYIHCMLVLVFSLFVCSEVVHVKWEVDMGDLLPELRQGKERTEEDTSTESKDRDVTTQKILVGLNKRSHIGAVAQINTEIDMAFLLPDLYKRRSLREKRSSASDNTDSVINTNRRSFTNYKQYHDHMKKLREVQALKNHNMVFKQKPSANNPLIYINNPVETGIEKSYLTLEEFKKVLTIRSQQDRQEFAKNHDQMAKHMNLKKETVKVRKLQSDDGTTPADKNKQVVNKEKKPQSSKTNTRSLKNATNQDNTASTKTGDPKSTTKKTKQTESADYDEYSSHKNDKATRSLYDYDAEDVVPITVSNGFVTERVVEIEDNTDGGFDAKFNIKDFTPEYLQPNPEPKETEYPDDTLTKRTKLSKPLVFMGGSNNNNNYNYY